MACLEMRIASRGEIMCNSEEEPTRFRTIADVNKPPLPLIPGLDVAVAYWREIHDRLSRVKEGLMFDHDVHYSEFEKEPVAKMEVVFALPDPHELEDKLHDELSLFRGDLIEDGCPFKLVRSGMTIDSGTRRDFKTWKLKADVPKSQWAEWRPCIERAVNDIRKTKLFQFLSAFTT